MSAEKFFTPKQVAHRLQVHLATVHRWIATGKLKAFRRAGSRYLISEQDMNNVLEPVENQKIDIGKTYEKEHFAAMEGLRKKGIKV